MYFYFILFINTVDRKYTAFINLFTGYIDSIFVYGIYLHKSIYLFLSFTKYFYIDLFVKKIIKLYFFFLLMGKKKYKIKREIKLIRKKKEKTKENKKRR